MRETYSGDAFKMFRILLDGNDIFDIQAIVSGDVLTEHNLEPGSAGFGERNDGQFLFLEAQCPQNGFFIGFDGSANAT
jgi:hypothetical protein